jgi:hypothetical protein
MSINTMANAAMERRSDYRDRLPRTAAERAAAASKDPKDQNTVSVALKTVTTYIPTEIITLYIALVGALQPGEPGTSLYFTSRWIAFGIFLVLTPFAIWATFASKLASDQKKLPLRVRYWPKWEMFAGTIAYVAWTIGLPDSPFAQFPWFSAAVGGFAILATSTLLGWVAGIFQRELAATGPAPTPTAAGAGAAK